MSRNTLPERGEIREKYISYNEERKVQIVDTVRI